MSGKVIVLASGAVVLALLVVLAAVAYASWPTADDDCNRVLVGEGGEFVEDLGPHGGGGDGAEFVGGDFDGEVEVAALADLDDGGRAAGGPRG